MHCYTINLKYWLKSGTTRIPEKASQFSIEFKSIAYLTKSEGKQQLTSYWPEIEPPCLLCRKKYHTSIHAAYKSCMLMSPTAKSTLKVLKAAHSLELALWSVWIVSVVKVCVRCQDLLEKKVSKTLLNTL